MTLQMLLCPGCRARVLENWTECKFCGEALTAEPIRATVHPDDLAAPAPPVADAPQPTGAQPAPPAGGSHDWSQWVNEPARPEVADAPPPPPSSADDFDYPVPPEPPDWDALAAADASAASGAPTLPQRGASSWDEAPQEQAGLHAVAPTPEPPMAGSTGPSDADAAGWGAPVAPELPPPPPQVSSNPWHGSDDTTPGAALEPIQGSAGEWVAGPAPVVPGVDDDLGPSGLEPVSWYTEPSGDAGSATVPEQDDQAPASPSLFGDRVGGAGGVGAAAAAAATAGHTEASFDADAIFRPEPEPAGALQRQQPAGEVAVQWKPAADAWNAPAEPEGTPKGQPVLSREVRLLAFGILGLIVIGLLANAALDRRNSYPAYWAPDVQGVAAWVSHERGLPFKHAIPVRTVDANEYARELASARSASSEDEKQALADRTATLRALGAVQGNSEDKVASPLLTDAGSGAFYDVRERSLVVRAGTNPTRLKVAVSGALSIALDDQYGDFSGVKSPSLSEEPLAAVVAGDAAVVRADYLAAQTVQVQGEFANSAPEQRPIEASFGAARAALEVGTGQALVRLVRAVGSTDDVNQLSVVPPSSDRQVIVPTAYLDGQRALVVGTPKAPTGAKELDSGTIGASTWYLLIAERLDAQRAFDVVDAWSGDSFITYREANGQVCVADVLRSADETTSGALLDTIKEWRDKVPGDHITVKQSGGDLVTVTACDPGEPAGQDLPAGYDQVVQAAVTRSALAATYYEQGTKVPNGPNGPIFTTEQVWCMANRVVSKARPEELADFAKGKGARFKSLTMDAGTACGSNLVAQFFRAPSGN